MKRGKPEINSVVHLYVEQFRKGMVQGVDYSLKVMCNHGGYHINYTDKPSEVTCPQCLERMKNNVPD